MVRRNDVIWSKRWLEKGKCIKVFSKLQSVTSRRINDDLTWPGSTVTVRRRLIEAKISVSRIGSDLPRNTSMTSFRVQYSFIDSTSADPLVLNSSHRRWSMVVQKSWFGDIFHITVLGLFIIYLGSRISLNTWKYLEITLPYTEEEMPLKWVFQQDDDPKHN